MSRLGAWPRRLAIALAVLLALWALAWLAVPPLLKSQAQSRLSELLGAEHASVEFFARAAGLR